MITVAVKYLVKPGFRDQVMALAKEAVTATRKEEGNIEYSVYASPENDQMIFVYEEWESKEALQAHVKTPHMKVFAESRKDMVLPDSYQLHVYESKPMKL